MVRDISSGSSSTTVYPEATNSNSLYFFVYSGGNKEFWITDGTEAGTLQSPVVSSQLSIYSDVVRIDNAYYLIAINPTNSTTDLYKLVDGQPHSPTHLATLVVDDHPSIVELFEADDDLYLRSLCIRPHTGVTTSTLPLPPSL